MKVLNYAGAFAAVGASLLMSGCATVYEGKYDWHEGWREGEVERVGAASDVDRPRYYECVRKAMPEQLAGTRFAVVAYRGISRTLRFAVPLPPGSSLAVGDAVYFKVRDCTVPPVPRAGRPRP